MAMNWPVFKTRALTAVIFVAVMSLGLLTNKWMFLLLFSVIHWGCWNEYQLLMAKIHPSYGNISAFHRYGVIIAGWGAMLFATAGHWMLGEISLSAIGFWIALIFAFVLPTAELLFSRNLDLQHLKLSGLGLLYISLSCSLMIHIRSAVIWTKGMGDESDIFYSIAQIFGFILPLVIIATIWINDTMAYVVGSFIGKRPLSPISPKKTWEGTIGGILLSTLLITLFGYFYYETWEHFLAISLITSVAGTFGDLFESKLKRMAGVKDSGHFMPGHGGFLDRFDSLLFAIPFVWLYVLIFQ